MIHIGKMTHKINFKYSGSTLSDTEALAQSIASLLQPGDVIILNGDLGTGKTQFTKSCVKALGYDQVVNSPSYTIANVYSTDTLEIVHADFYRFNHALELLDTALDDYYEHSIFFIEWGGDFQDMFDHYLSIQIEFHESGEEGRQFTLEPHGAKWATRMEKLQHLTQKNDQK